MKFIIFTLAFVSTVYAQNATTAAPAAVDPPLQNEFDKLLVETMVAQMTRMEYRLIELGHEITHLETSKDKDEQAKVIREIEMMMASAEGAAAIFTRELARKDLNILEQYNFESAVKVNQILIKNLKAAEVRVKALKL